MDNEAATASAPLQRANREAGLAQAELAARAGTTQSVVSAHESQPRQPVLPTLAALIDATGCEFVVEIRRQ
ncbi:MAG: helix-turn-helix transcriptional regulator [Actinomycetota bacterium]|nr:helix-turn-helix transcriptional regulator [Actinomycetota bacterium]